MRLSLADKIICLTSLAVGILFLFLLPTQFSSDSIEYYQWGLKILHKHGGQFRYTRTSGYPLLMVLTGSYWLGNFKLLEIVQMAMAVATPIVLYFTVKPFHARIAFIMSLLVIALAYPYFYARILYTEAYYLFILMALFWASARYLRLHKGIRLVIAFAFLAATIKPTAVPLFYVILAVFYFLSPLPRRDRLRHYGKVLLVFLALTTVSTVVRYYTVDPIVGPADPTITKFSRSQISSLTSATSMSSRMLFWQAYGGLLPYHVVNGQPTSLVLQQNGPASKRLFDTMQAYLKAHPENWTPLGPYEFFGVYKGKPDALLAHMFEKPNLTYHWFMWVALDSYLGPQEAGKLLLDVSLEAFEQDPYALWGVADNFLFYFFDPDRNSNSGTMLISPKVICCPFLVGDPMPKELQDSMTEAYKSGKAVFDDSINHMSGFFIWGWVVSRTLLALAAWLTLIPGLQSRYKPLVLLCWAFILPQAVITSLFAAPASRYIDMTLAFVFIAGGLGIAALYERRKNAA